MSVCVPMMRTAANSIISPGALAAAAALPAGMNGEPFGISLCAATRPITPSASAARTGRRKRGAAVMLGKTMRQTRRYVKRALAGGALSNFSRREQQRAAVDVGLHRDVKIAEAEPLERREDFRLLHPIT